MRLYKIFRTKQFDRELKRLDNSLIQQIQNEVRQLEINPYVGKPLGYSFFREKKIRNYRVYYLIYTNYLVVFMIAISDKKNQQDVINQIKTLIPNYREEIETKLNV